MATAVQLSRAPALNFSKRYPLEKPCFLRSAKYHFALNDYYHQNRKRAIYSCFTEQRRYYCQENSPVKKPDWTDRAKNLGGAATGFAQLITAVIAVTGCFYAWYKEEAVDQKEQAFEAEKQKNKWSTEATERLGLTRVMNINRTLEEQANDYGKAKSDLYIIGITGARVLDKTLEGNNPVPSSIEHLLSSGVKVYLMIYEPNFHPDLEDKKRIQKSVDLAKALKRTYPQLFHLKQIKEFPPFHGDLIDQQEAHITPVRRAGINHSKNANMEIYCGKTEKMGGIRSDFQHVWDKAEIVKGVG